jgi:hypothetical protein
MMDGLEITGKLVTGLPGAILRLTWSDGTTKASLFGQGGDRQNLKFQERNEWGQHQCRVDLPDGTDLLVLRDPSLRIELTRFVGENGCKAGFEPDLDGGLRMTDFELSHRVDFAGTRWSLGGDSFESKRPRTWLTSSSESRSHSLLATAGYQPVLIVPVGETIPETEALKRLEETARTICGKHELS